MFKFFYEKKTEKKPTKKNVEEYLKFRKSDKEINDFYKLCEDFWNDVKTNLDVVKDFISVDINPAKKHRNSKGGNVLFRPIGLLPFVKSIIKIKSRKEKIQFKAILLELNSINLDMTKTPWIYVVWNPISERMIMSNMSLTELIFIYKYQSDLLTKKEMEKLKKSYASKISYENESLDKVLKLL